MHLRSQRLTGTGFGNIFVHLITGHTCGPRFVERVLCEVTMWAALRIIIACVQPFANESELPPHEVVKHPDLPQEAICNSISTRLLLNDSGNPASKHPRRRSRRASSPLDISESLFGKPLVDPHCLVWKWTLIGLVVLGQMDTEHECLPDELEAGDRWHPWDAGPSVGEKMSSSRAHIRGSVSKTRSDHE